MTSDLFHMLNQIAPLEPEAQAYIGERFHVRHVQKGDFFLREGEVCRRIAFLQQGLVRYFVYKHDREATFEFTQAGEFIGDYASFTRGVASKQNIQAIEDCRLLEISFDALQEIFRHVDEGQLLGRVIVEHRFAVMVDQLTSIYMQNPDERYFDFVQRYRALSQRIPQYMIASYIGVQPQSLSRIRRR